MADEALLRFVSAAQEMEYEAEEGARIVRTAVLAVEAVGENQRFQMRGFERAIEELAQAAGGACRLEAPPGPGDERRGVDPRGRVAP